MTFKPHLLLILLTWKSRKYICIIFQCQHDQVSTAILDLEVKKQLEIMVVHVGCTSIDGMYSIEDYNGVLP